MNKERFKELATKTGARKKSKGVKIMEIENNIISSEDCAQINSSENYTQINLSGNRTQINSSGNDAKINSSGHFAKIDSSGDDAQINSSGYCTQINLSGNRTQINSSGNCTQINSSGDFAKINSSGDVAQINSSGNRTQINSSGDSAIISAVGLHSMVKAKKGSWITLAEYVTSKIYVKTEFVDGEKIKEDTQYILYNKEFHEIIVADNIASIVLQRKGNVYKVVNMGEDKSSYLLCVDGIYSHGATIKEAKESLIFKISNRDTSMYKDYTLDTVVTFEEAVKMYRCITGACEQGTKYFCTTELKRKKTKYTIKEIIKLTENQYGHETFKEFFEVNNAR